MPRRKDTPMTVNGTSAGHSMRINWVDYAKGICIVMVVMMHSVLGVEAAAGQTGFMHALVAFAKPFRMPDFFLISGLFLSVVIDRDWRTYLDRKAVHFAYFYVLWVTIQFGFNAPSFARRPEWLRGRCGRRGDGYSSEAVVGGIPSSCFWRSSCRWPRRERCC